MNFSIVQFADFVGDRQAEIYLYRALVVESKCFMQHVAQICTLLYKLGNMPVRATCCWALGLKV